VSEAVAELVARAIGVAVNAVRVDLRPPVEHQSNRLYDVRVDGRHLIAKEFLKPDEFTTSPWREHRALELVAPLDLAPAPVCIEPAATAAHGPVVVYEYLEGEAWDRRRPTAAQLGRLARTWLVVNRVPTDGLWPSRGQERSFAEAEAWFREGLRAYGGWAAAEFPPGRRGLDLCLELLERRRPIGQELGDREPLLCFCRSDPRFANVIERPDGRIAMVDWEDSGLRDPARDLADLATHPNQEDLLSADDLAAFLGPYLAERSALDADLERRMQLYLAIFPLFWLADLMRSGARRAQTGRLSGWSINGLPPNARLRRYLARALAWPASDFSAQLDPLADLSFFPPG
jgi:aminoglycoside phosphotransferase (APT) family kinase protein